MRLHIIGRMLLGGTIRRALWRSPRALLIIAAIAGFVLMSIGTARAQDVSRCASNDLDAICQTRSDAYAQASAALMRRWSSPPPGAKACLIAEAVSSRRVEFAQSSYLGGSSGSVCPPVGVPQGTVTRRWLTDCPSDKPWDPVTKMCKAPCDFNAPALTGGYTPSTGNLGFPASDPNGCPIQVCQDGCAYNDPGTASLTFVVVDGVAHCSVSGWRPAGQTCTASGAVGSVGSPPTDSDADGTSDGFDPSPNNPGSGGGGGEGGASQPEDGQCGGHNQPECGTPGSGSGNGNTSGGGGNCSTPPSSSGDAILAQIAYQTWATRCAIEGRGTSGGADGGAGDGQPDWTKGNAPPVPDDGTDYVESSKRFGIDLSPDLLDRENIFGAGSCPQFSVTVLSATVSTADFPAWCSVIAPAMRGLILLMGAFTALGILLGRFGV